MMKRNLYYLFVLSFFFAACTGGSSDQSSSEAADEESTDETTMEASGEAQTVSVDTEASKVMWEGTMMGLYSHSGVVSLKEGQLEMQGDDIVGGTFVVDLTTITPTDENYTPEEGRTKDKLVGHLSSDDFFNVEEFPTASFTVTSYDASANSVTGDLTIRGNTHEETIQNVSVDSATGKVTGTLTFDRTKYDVSFQHPAQDMVLSDDIELEIELSTMAESV